MPDKKRKCFTSAWLHFHNIYLGKWHTELKFMLFWVLHVHHSPVKPSCSSAHTPKTSRSSNILHISLDPSECSLMPYDMASAVGWSLFGWGVSKSDLINYDKKKHACTKIGSIWNSIIKFKLWNWQIVASWSVNSPHIAQNCFYWFISSNFKLSYFSLFWKSGFFLPVLSCWLVIQFLICFFENNSTVI